jgi:PAS domain S-box-containing protein
MDRTRRRAEALTRALIDDAPDAFFLADLDGRYTDVNEAACKLLGYRREDLLGKAIVDLLRPEDAARLAAMRDRLLVPGAIENGA